MHASIHACVRAQDMMCLCMAKQEVCLPAAAIRQLNNNNNEGLLALRFALQPVSYSLQSRQRSPTVPNQTPATLMDIPSVKAGQQIYKIIRIR